VNLDQKTTNRNQLLEEILTPHICGSSWSTVVPTPQDVVVGRVMGIASADCVFRSSTERIFLLCQHAGTMQSWALEVAQTRQKGLDDCIDTRESPP